MRMGHSCALADEVGKRKIKCRQINCDFDLRGHQSPGRRLDQKSCGERVSLHRSLCAEVRAMQTLALGVIARRR
jgi:hypothetical protein